MALTQVTIESNKKDVQITCPKCQQWEQLGIDDPRKRFNTLPIEQWLPDNTQGHEVSENKCVICSTQFHVIWDYTNPFS